MPPESTDSRSQILARFRSLFSDAEPSEPSTPRASKRVSLPIPVRLQVGAGEPQALKLRDVSLHGLCVEGSDAAAPADEVTVHFEGYPEICEPFALCGRVVRTESEPVPALALIIDRQATPAPVLDQFRRLVLHYLHHRPLLDRVAKGFSEARCVECGWMGHVGVKSLRCSRCGGAVRPITKPPESA